MKTLKMGPGRGLIPIPPEVAPTSLTCVQIMIPDSVAAKRQLLGMMRALSRWNQYDRDAAHSAKAWADIWKLACQESVDVCMNIEFRQPSSCSLEMRVNGGAWSEIFNAYNCGFGAASDRIQQMLESGQLGPGGQQSAGAGGAPDPGSCTTYHAEVPANGRWLCPIAVDDDYIITVTNAGGGAWDGDILHEWQCPDGEVYIAGACAGGGFTSVSDPLPGVNHMRLIGQANGIYFDMDNASYTIPGGTGPTNLYLQVNDNQAALTDNQGSYFCDVSVCRPGWHHTFDFRTGMHGFSFDNPGTMAQGASGLYSTWSGSGQDGVYIKRNDVGAVSYIKAKITLSNALTGNNPEASVRNYSQTDAIFDVHSSSAVYSASATKTMTGLFCLIDPWDGGYQAWSGFWQTLELWGMGADPF